jgi:hypothetical protein
MLPHVMRDFLAEHGALHVGGAEVDARPDSSIDDLLGRIREAVEAPRSTRFVAERAEGNLVGTEEVLKRLHECRGGAAVADG